MDDDIIMNDEMIPTKEYLKQQRKVAYEAAKLKAREEKAAEKERLKEERAAAQKEKDQLLWDAMGRGDQSKEWSQVFVDLAWESQTLSRLFVFLPTKLGLVIFQLNDHLLKIF